MGSAVDSAGDRKSQVYEHPYLSLRESRPFRTERAIRLAQCFNSKHNRKAPPGRYRVRPPDGEVGGGLEIVSKGDL